jgi:prepilin-type N-terminal cleavage/methylation domain-containing protein
MIKNKKSAPSTYYRIKLMKSKLEVPKAFTIIEVMLATFISTIVMGFIFIFLSDISS